MEDLTCPNCNCDTDEAELKRNNLRCPTCGFDMADSKDEDGLDDEDDEDDEDEDEDEDEDDEEDEKE